jgi:hypothetical protein
MGWRPSRESARRWGRKMKIIFAALIVLLLAPVEMLASSIVSRAARDLAQAALVYANDHDERLPGSLEEIPGYERILEQYRIPVSQVSYVAPPDATVMWPSNTPLIMIRYPHELVTVVTIASGTEFYRWTPSIRPHQNLPAVGALLLRNPVLTISLIINVLLVILLYNRIRNKAPFSLQRGPSGALPGVHCGNSKAQIE